MRAMRFLPVKVNIVRVLWYLKNGKAEFRRSLKIDKDNYIPFSIPMINGENGSSLYKDPKEMMKMMMMIR